MVCILHKKESAEQLKSKGLKITTGRLGLLDIFKHNKKPLAVKEIAKIFKQYGKIDLVTLYRNVENLAETGIIKKLNISSTETFFEMPEKHHHHLICTNCGKIKDIINCHLALPNTKINGFSKIQDHSLEFFGICNKCAK